MRTSQAGIEPIEDENPFPSFDLETPGEEEAVEPIEDYSRPEDYEDHSPNLPLTGKL